MAKKIVKNENSNGDGDVLRIKVKAKYSKDSKAFHVATGPNPLKDYIINFVPKYDEFSVYGSQKLTKLHKKIFLEIDLDWTGKK